MTQIDTMRTLLFLGALITVSMIDRTSAGVQVNIAAGPVQQNSGCSGQTAAACDLRTYEIMVESFVDGDSTRNYNAGYGTSHHKGDLRGIINSLDYIKSLGMNAIWMTPVFDSHAGEAQQGGGVNLKLDATGYYTRDYFKIDPKFGSLTDAQELVTKAHEKGLYVFFDGVFGHNKGNLVASPTGKLPASSSPGVSDYSAPQTVDFYKEVATYWINQLGIDGWRLDQSYQVPPSAWRDIRAAVESASVQRAQAGQQWGTLGYMVAEDWSDAGTIANRTFGPEANPILHSAFDFPVRYAVVGVLAGEESGLSGRPASVISESWAYGAHDNVYADNALPNLMLGNHDLVRFGDLLERANIAYPNQPEYWARHRLAFMFQASYSGPITRYYGEEIGDEVPNYAAQVTNNCANLGLCDDHVARTSAKILGVTVTSQNLSADQLALLQFHQNLMTVRSEYPALSHGARQHLYSDDVLYVDLKSYNNQQIMFAMNTSNQALTVQLNQSLFSSPLSEAWDILTSSQVSISSGYLNFVLAPLSGSYILVNASLLLPGDYNHDGILDAADYVVWRKTDGTQAGYNTWRAHFGHPIGSGTGAIANTAVPEPTTLMLLMFAAADWCLRRSRTASKVPATR
jgi:glycosidase